MRFRLLEHWDSFEECSSAKFTKNIFFRFSLPQSRQLASPEDIHRLNKFWINWNRCHYVLSTIVLWAVEYFRNCLHYLNLSFFWTFDHILPDWQSIAPSARMFIMFFYPPIFSNRFLLLKDYSYRLKNQFLRLTGDLPFKL